MEREIRLGKFSKVLLVALLLGIGFWSFQPQKAEAARTPWVKPYFASSACKVRIWTDATTYTKRAKTVDFTVEQNGKCGKLKYEATLIPIGVDFFKTSQAFGTFSRITPIKKLSVDIPFYKKRGSDSVVGVNLETSSTGKFLGMVRSELLHIHKQ